MGYQMSNGQASGTDDVTIISATAMTATTNGSAVDVRHGVLALTLNVTAIAGTPTLDVSIETRKDASDAWRAIASFAQKTGVASERKCFSGVDRQVRAVCTVGGSTPSLTFTISGDCR